MLALEASLSRMFYREPRVAYVLPDETARHDVLPLFFRSVLIPAVRSCGEIYTMPQVEVCSLWIRPALLSALAGIVRTRMQALQPILPPSSLRKWATLNANMEVVHRRVAKEAHWYLLALRIQPSRPENRSEWKSHRAQPSIEDASGVLVDPVLSWADRDHHSCYVENFDETCLPFYEERGFRIAAAGRLPDGGPDFWAMIRRPTLRLAYQQNAVTDIETKELQYA